MSKEVEGKICCLNGSYAASRLWRYFRGKPSTIKIMTNEAYSLGKIFGSDSIRPYCPQFEVYLIVNKSNVISEDDLKLMKTLMGDRFHYKYVDNVWTNLFLKSSSNRINLDLYGFGYDPFHYHERNKNYTPLFNRGFSLKIYNDKIKDELEKWFDTIWEREKMIQIPTSKILSSDVCSISEGDGGGHEFECANVEISNTYSRTGITYSIDVHKFIVEDKESENISSKAKLCFYDNKFTFIYDSESNMNLCITFKDENVLEVINELLQNMSNDERNYLVTDFDYLLEKEEIYSHQLYAYLMFNYGNQYKTDLMHKHYIDIRPDDGERKFALTCRAVAKKHQTL